MTRKEKLIEEILKIEVMLMSENLTDKQREGYIVVKGVLERELERLK